jgi:hypothetical protein
MKAQEIVTIIASMPTQSMRNGPLIKMYPELNPYFDKGMYIETFTQTLMTSEVYIITFIFRNYNASQSNG